MAKNDNLTDFLTDVADAIREKKGTTDKINPQDFSSEIASIQGGGDIWGFDKIGYYLNNVDIQSSIAHSLAKLDSLTPSNLTSNFANDKKIVFAPYIDMSKEKAISRMYYGCTALCFVPQLDLLNATNASYIFYECYALQNVKIKNSQNVSYWIRAFRSCRSLQGVDELDFSNVVDMTYAFFENEELNFLRVKNLGKSTLVTYDFSEVTNWGTGGEENRLSLIDSLITYSYDRASNGMATATIKLSANTKALLTDDEIAQITQKGYTIA